MRQAYAILLDSLRMLRASSLFWISIGISMLVALLYASIGFHDKGVSFLFGLWKYDAPLLRKGTPEAEQLYVLLFTDVIVRYWLGWFSLALALVSTCSIFPQFLQRGSIDLVLSKPISRARIFLLKYVGGLLFVALQTFLFSLIVFFAVGLRLGEWNITLFWAVPIVTFSFSLIYCVSVFIGVTSRSSVFAFLGAGVFWLLLLFCQWGEDFWYKLAYVFPEVGLSMDMSTGQINQEEADATQGLRNGYDKMRPAFNSLPKTRELIASLKRLVHFEERDSMLTGVDLGTLFSGSAPDPRVTAAMEKYNMRYSWASIIGSSLAFELTVLGLALVIFLRRDY